MSSFVILFLTFSVVVVVAGAFQEDELHFVALGDWGGNEHRTNVPFPFTTSVQLGVAATLAKHVRKTRARFVLSLGDNFYQSGVTSVDDARFGATFERVYDDPALVNVPWYMVAGNHDHLGSVEAQIAYSRRSSRWRFPREFYVERFAFGRNLSMAVIFLDCTLLQAQWMRRPVVADAYGDMLRSLEQEHWLNRTLEATRDADWLCVACHMPIMSVAEYAGNPTMIQLLQPLLEQYGAAFYVSGHTHTLQHLRHNRVNYVVSGCGATANTNRWNWFNVPHGSLRFCWPQVNDQADSGFTKQDGGFAAFTLHDATTASIQFFDSPGNRLYKTTITNPRGRRS